MIRVMGYMRVVSRLHSCTVGAYTHVRAIGVTLPFPARPTIPAIMLVIKDNDASRRFVKRTTRLVVMTENESSEKRELISW